MAGEHAGHRQRMKDRFLANGLEGAPCPSSATQGCKVSEGGAEGPCGRTCSLWGLGAPVENQSSTAT